MKKFNNIKKSLLFCSSVFLLTSCTDVLNTNPITDEIYQSQDGAQVLTDAVAAEQAMRNVNSIFGDEFWQFDYFVAGDAGSDVAYAGADQEDFFQIDEYRMISTNYVAARDWGHVMDEVKRCNLILNYVDGVPDLAPARKDEMIGEASLYRALCRFQGVQIWGDFPIVDKFIPSISAENFESVYPSLYPDRKPIAQVYAAIIADCEVALAKAPAASFKFRANKGAANALLAKVYATMPNPDWTKVNQYSDAVIGGGYTLLPTYNFLFDNNHEGNAESIWEANGAGPGSPINSWCTDVLLGQNWKKFNTPSHTIYNAFVANGEGGAATPAPSTPVKRGDVSILRKPTSFSDPYWTQLFKFPFPNKMRKTDGTQNFYVFRLADILLLKAEALAHTGDLPGALVLVNKVRARVNITPLTAFSSPDDAINKILKERFTELAFEGQRWFDLKREGKAVEILSQQTYTKNSVEIPMPYVGNLNQNDLLWPVPQAVLDNNPNITQNPGY